MNINFEFFCFWHFIPNTDKELHIAGQEYKYKVHIFKICNLQIGI